MKKLVLLMILAIVLLSSCQKTETYEPNFTLAEGFTLEGDRISATLIGTEELFVSDVLLTSEAVTVFADTTGDRYVQGLDAKIPLKAGENRMVIRLENGTRQKEYELHLTCVEIRGFTVTVIDPEKTYHIGETFDRSTVRVTAVTADGKTMEITQYQPEYEFSSLGKSTVGIELGGYYESISVMVTAPYQPTLDGDLSADGISYLIEDGEAMLTDGTAREGFFAVPAAVSFKGKEYPVTKIAPLAFEGAWLTGIMIPEGVESIGDEAFSGCEALEWIEFPETMKSIGAFAFSDCTSLYTVLLPEGLEKIADGTFRDCEALMSIGLPSTLKTIGTRAFFGCKALENIDLPSGLAVIGESAFENCSALSTVVVEKLSTLSSNAFAGCDALKVFAAGYVETIGSNIFPKSKALTVYMRAGSMLLMEADRAGAESVFMKDGDYQIVSLPTEFPIEEDYPYEETLILHLSDRSMTILSDYTVTYPKDVCGYTEASITAEGFSHTFSVFISYTEPIAFDSDTRGVRYHLDRETGRATLLSAPAWVKKSEVYEPEKEGLFLVPTTLFYEDTLYVVTEIAEGALSDAVNVQEIFVPILETEASTEDSPSL